MATLTTQQWDVLWIIDHSPHDCNGWCVYNRDLYRKTIPQMPESLVETMERDGQYYVRLTHDAKVIINWGHHPGE